MRARWRARAADGLRFFAGEPAGAASPTSARPGSSIASANWLATASHAAQRIADGVLVDIGSTTTDLIALSRTAACCGSSRSDAQRLASGELVYHGVVRTPLCALGAAHRLGAARRST